MNIGVFGASGVIGGCVLDEAAARGHAVTAFTRDASQTTAGPVGTTWESVDVLDAEDVARAIAGLDVVVNAINAGDDIAETIDNADVFPDAARALLSALGRQPSTRLIVIGGAGSLEVEPGLQVMDVEGFADQLPDILGVPADYFRVIRAHREALDVYRLSNRLWTYVSPSAGLVTRAGRTGRFRVGGDQLLVSADGESDISAEDLAVAVVDEAEVPRHVQRRFTVAY